MKRKVIRVVSLLLVLILLLTGCVTADKMSALLPHYEELSSLIGLTKEEALEKMGWQEGDLEPWKDEHFHVEGDDSLLLTPMEAEIGGVPFKVKWGFANKLDALNTIEYAAVYKGDVKTAVKDILKVANAIGSTIGKKTIYDNLGLFDMTEEELREVLRTPALNTKEVSWNLNKLADATKKDYMKELKDTAFYEDSDPGYYFSLVLNRVEATVYLSLYVNISSDPNEFYPD